jgi:hypothetical protein
MIVHKHGDGTTTNQPFLYRPSGWTYPGAPTAAIDLTGINDRGAVVASGGTSSAAYTLQTEGSLRWTKLTAPAGATGKLATFSIDAKGDVAGSLNSPGSGDTSEALEWMHTGRSYRIRMLPADRPAWSSVVAATDHFGDAVGWQAHGGSMAYATVWTPWGAAYELPSLGSATGFSQARAMAVRQHGASRVLVVVGASENRAGVRQACEWRVTVSDHHIEWGQPLDIGTATTGSTVAVGISSTGWVIGNMAAKGGSAGGFLWRPQVGFEDLRDLLSPTGGWKLFNVTGIDGSGQIIGQARGPTDPAAVTRAVLMTPRPATVMPPRRGRSKRER